MLTRLLEYLNGVCDCEGQQRIHDLHMRTLRWEKVERLPLVISYPLSNDRAFRPIPHREIFCDPRKMLYNELVWAFESSIALQHQIGDDLPYTIRGNFGAVIIASMFGGRIEQVGDNPPWVRAFEDQSEVAKIFEIDPTDLSQGWCSEVIEFYEFFHITLKHYPRLWRAVRIVLPDLQGPLDTAEMLLGSNIFLKFFDDPEMIAELLGTLAQAQVGLAKRLQPFLKDDPDGFSYQHGSLQGGNILLRDDTSVMISPEMYRDHVGPHDEHVLREMGGGSIHSCGRIEHNIPEFFSLPSICGVDFGDAQMNDIDRIYRCAQPRKIPLIRVEIPKEELLSGKIMQRFPTGVSLTCHADSMADAARIMEGYRAKKSVQ